MARGQTIFSELLLAGSISGESNIKEIQNVCEKTFDEYQKELSKRVATKNGVNSINVLENAGRYIQQYIRSLGIDSVSVSWTGSENVGGMVSVAKDIEIKPVNLRVSVKENANVFINGSPITVFEDMPNAHFGIKQKGEDWFVRVAPEEFQQYYIACGGEQFSGYKTIQEYYSNVPKKERKGFQGHVKSLHNSKNTEVLKYYKILCNKVSGESANIFNQNIDSLKKLARGRRNFLQPIFHYFFKINGINYILAGAEKNKPFAVLLPPSSDWIKKFEFVNIVAKPKLAGQPEVLLLFYFKNKKTKEEYEIELKVEIRWSHGKFCGNPEAKVYKTWNYASLPWAFDLSVSAY